MNTECVGKCWKAKECDFEGVKPEECSSIRPMIKAADDSAKCKVDTDYVNHPNHYAGQIEVIDYIRDKLTPEGFTEYCCGNVLKYVSLWRKKDGVQGLKKARVYLDWMIENAEREVK